MSGDYTRFTFAHHKNYSGVLKQQGRVDLDADFNECIEILDRRWRSETIDIIDHCVVPNTTPDAFLITPTGLGAFEIGIGRMYVDGIQVENHGLPPLEYQADLGELRGTTRIPYSDQPYLPAPLPEPLAANPGTTDLIYLDVWQREVTVVEDPALREIALGGPDTTTRVQAVWQVRALQNVGSHGCGDPIEAWNNLVAPSAGRLNTSTVAPPASDDPCFISPSGGYRGLENRLYRVQIHAVGPIGGAAPAKFKWSRNNASIVSPVTAIPSTTDIEVQQVGRDQVLRFDVGGWIEITDDYREFQGLAGHMAQITAIDEANRLLTFAPAIPGTINFDATDAARHTRVCRWDQTQNVDANGLLDVAAGPIEIEDGIRVTFSFDPGTGSFRVGDYWVFAARTADGSVEDLTAAPPRGILHHYCRLGFIHWGPPITFDDCRDHWPTCECGGGECTVTVGDGVDSHGQFTDIQQAINALGTRGGLVCIGRGFYVVRTGLMVDGTKRNVTIRGTGPATRIVFVPEQTGALLTIAGTDHVRLEQVYAAGFGAEALVRIDKSSFVTVQDCTLVNLPRREGQEGPAPRVIDIGGGCSHCEVVHNHLLSTKAIAAMSGQVTEVLIRDNRVLSLQSAVAMVRVAGLEVIRNQFRGLPQKGLFIEPVLDRQAMDALQANVTALFRAAPSSNTFQAACIIVYTGNRVIVESNLITAQVAVLGFLLLNTRIRHNDIVCLIGLLVLFSTRVKVEDNFVFGLLAGVIHAGMVLDFDATSNEMLGMFGIVFMSTAELVRTFAAILGGALGAVGFGSAGGATVTTHLSSASAAVGEANGFGLAAIVKIHRNVFLTFVRGVYKTDPVLSADFGIIDNTFSLARIAGVELGGMSRQSEIGARLFSAFLTQRHLIQSNSIAGTGAGIITSTSHTFAEQNSIHCRANGIALDAPFCTARNNFIRGLSTDPVPQAGLILLTGVARNATISGNRLLSAPGFSVLVRDNIADLVVDDNVITGAQRMGVGTLNDVVLVSRGQFSRNRFEQCIGATAAGAANEIGGVLRIGAGSDIRVFGNTFRNSIPVATAGTVLFWFVVYMEDVSGAEVSDNLFEDNANVAMQGTLGAIGLQGVAGLIRIQNNVALRNGGFPLAIAERVTSQQRVLVENNHFVAGLNQSTAFAPVYVEGVEWLIFSGNHCQGAAVNTPTPAPGPGGLTVQLLSAGRGTVSGNQIDGGMTVSGGELVVNGNTANGSVSVSASPTGGVPARGFVSLNITAALSVSGPLTRVHNLPAP